MAENAKERYEQALIHIIELEMWAGDSPTSADEALDQALSIARDALWPEEPRG